MRKSPVLMVVPLLALTLAGCGGGGDKTVSPPAVTAPSVTPTELRFTGGAVNVSATVTAEAGVAQVVAAVAGPAGTQNVLLALSGAQYAGTFNAPANAQTAAAAYTVTVTATDTDGRTSAPSGAAQFTVQAAESPPGAPSGW